jgi:hypothetical protein
MKKALLWIGVVVVLAGAAAWWVATHHIIRTRHGTVVLEKRFLTFDQTWADARGWKLEDFEAHPAVKKALLQDGYGDLLAELRREQVDDSVKKLATETDEAFEALKEYITGRIDEWLSNVDQASKTNAAGGATNAPAAVPAAPDS